MNRRATEEMSGTSQGMEEKIKGMQAATEKDAKRN
jgi:hypothetical protein